MLRTAIVRASPNFTAYGLSSSLLCLRSPSTCLCRPLQVLRRRLSTSKSNPVHLPPPLNDFLDLPSTLPPTTSLQTLALNDSFQTSLLTGESTPTLLGIDHHVLEHCSPSGSSSSSSSIRIGPGGPNDLPDDFTPSLPLLLLASLPKVRPRVRPKGG